MNKIQLSQSMFRKRAGQAMKNQKDKKISFTHSRLPVHIQGLLVLLIAVVAVCVLPARASANSISSNSLHLLTHSFNLFGATTAADTTKPTVSMAAPAPGSNVTTSPITLGATANDNVKVTKVEFYRSGLTTPVATTTASSTAGWTASWNINVANGSYSITAKAYDAAGNIGVSTPITVNINVPTTVSCGTGSVPTDKGVSTATVTVPATGTYRLWSRMNNPDGVNDSYTFQVDGCATVDVGGGGAIPVNTWTWVDYSNGVASNKVNVSLTQGTHTIKMAGREANVKLDKVMLISDSCVPTGTGTNCSVVAPVDNPPAISAFTANPSSTTAGTNVALSATATDDKGVARVDFMNGSTVIASDTSPPYTATFSTTGLAAGNYTLTAKAYDTTSQSVTATTSVTITSTTTKTADLNNDNVVDFKDANIVYNNWGKSGIGDLNHDGVVGFADMNVMYGQWTLIP